MSSIAKVPLGTGDIVQRGGARARAHGSAFRHSRGIRNVFGLYSMTYFRKGRMLVVSSILAAKSAAITYTSALFRIRKMQVDILALTITRWVG